ncbi:MAG: tyrosine-type recombinase/integrase [Clostridia bacterium]|nr:tyrosine-type recombinase/integrase [Clostridia bacterium]
MCLRTAKPLLNGGTGYVIGGGEQPITESMFDHALERIGKTINLHGATPHVLRHTYLTMLGETGTNIKTIQAIAGHADIQTTMNRYVYSRNEKLLEAGRNFDHLTRQLTNTTAEESLYSNPLTMI